MASDLPNAQEPSPASWPTEQQARLDYAWNWFDFHAEQRTKMFNYMLLGLGILATAVATTLQKGQALEAMVLSIAAVGICLAFFQMDRRNRELYKLGQKVLSDIESKQLFPDPEKGITKQIDKEDADRDPRWRLRGWEGGQHRYWMPFVIGVFAALFVLAASRATYMHNHPSAYSSEDKTIVVCCQTTGASGTKAPNRPSDLSGQPGAPLPAEGTWNISGWHLLSIGGGLLLIIVGGFMFMYKSKVLGSTLVTAGLATAALPNFSIPVHADLHLDPHFEGKIEADIEAKVDHLLDLFRKSQPALMDSVRFGGFGEGLEAFDCKLPSNADLVRKTTSAISSAQSRALQPIVLLVGGTDRKPLSPALRTRYENNTGLARARVNAIEECLGLGGERTDGNLRPEVIRLVTGPSYTPTSRDPDETVRANLAEDREVRVLVLGLRAERP